MYAISFIAEYDRRFVNNKCKGVDRRSSTAFTFASTSNFTIQLTASMMQRVKKYDLYYMPFYKLFMYCTKRRHFQYFLKAHKLKASTKASPFQGICYFLNRTTVRDEILAGHANR